MIISYAAFSLYLWFCWSTFLLLKNIFKHPRFRLLNHLPIFMVIFVCFSTFLWQYTSKLNILSIYFQISFWMIHTILDYWCKNIISNSWRGGCLLELQYIAKWNWPMRYLRIIRFINEQLLYLLLFSCFFSW